MTSSSDDTVGRPRHLGAAPAPAEPDVVTAIRERGPLPFSEYQAIALYGPNGFYTSGAGAGRRRDFQTSPETGALFGAVMARAVERVWERLGRPDPFIIVDAGAGPGTLVRSMMLARPRWLDAAELILVEVARPLRAVHPDGPRITSADSLPDRAHVIIANELLDNLVIDIVEWTRDGWRAVCVDLALVAGVDAAGEDAAGVDGVRPRLRWCLGGPTASPPGRGADASHGVPVGARVPVCTAAARWVAEALDRVVPGGELVVIDYATSTTSELASRSFLRTYRRHVRGDDAMREPGSWDITSDVAADQLPAPNFVCTQHHYLREHGIEEIVAEAAVRWRRGAAAPTMDDFRARSATVEAPVLLDPSGLGGFLVMRWIGGSHDDLSTV